ncbi:hypothetical protein SAMN04488134_102183 [Amphibacillus marinus]|uniref:ABC-2 family transporter protein n=1 Tax=Amphibacillus marinus TaxID=872970 RepID=A0A1H8K5P5_9BACI|nr:hypothetical protein [Amphibacillus marinus]SEN88264.1 hypothetical protein SAMN04488134_102183 [Amphibacillus marinus]
MSPFVGLLKKDYRIASLTIWLAGALLLLGFLLGFISSNRSGHHTFMMLTLFSSTFFLVFFMPAMMLILLRKEARTQLWLYSPRSSFSLFASKLIVMLSYQAIFQLIVFGYGLLTIQLFDPYILSDLHTETAVRIVIFVYFLFLFSGAAHSIIVFFYWSVYHTLYRYIAQKSLRLLVLFSIFCGYIFLESRLLNLSVTQSLIANSRISIIGDQALTNQGDWILQFQVAQVPLFYVGYYLLVVLLLLYISCMLLTRKVEV